MCSKLISIVLLAAAQLLSVVCAQSVTVPASSVGGNTTANVGITSMSSSQVLSIVTGGMANGTIPNQSNKPWTLNFVGQTKVFQGSSYVLYGNTQARYTEASSCNINIGPCYRVRVQSDGSLQIDRYAYGGAWFYSAAPYPAFRMDSTMITTPVGSSDPLFFYTEVCGAVSSPSIVVYPYFNSSTGALQSFLIGGVNSGTNPGLAYPGMQNAVCLG